MYLIALYHFSVFLKEQVDPNTRSDYNVTKNQVQMRS